MTSFLERQINEKDVNCYREITSCASKRLNMETSAKKAKRNLVEAISLSLDQVSSLLRLLSHNLHSKASPRLGCAPTRGENCRSACSVALLLVATNTTAAPVVGKSPPPLMRCKIHNYQKK